MILSEKQKKALRNDRINRGLGVVGGVFGFAQSLKENEDASLLTHLVTSVMVGATISFFSSLFFPVKTEDILNFEDEKNYEK